MQEENIVVLSEGEEKTNEFANKMINEIKELI